MQESHPIRKIFNRLLPNRPAKRTNEWDQLDAAQKNELSLQFIAKGEIALLNNDEIALTHFESAACIDERNPGIWYRGGLALFDFGLKRGNEKALLLASRYFKLAAQLSPEMPEIWTAWGSVLLQLGIAYNEHHYYLEAKEKCQRAIATSASLPRPIQAQLYWDYGLVWTELAQHSGEAVDVRLAIEAFSTAMESFTTPSSAFLHDSGNAYFQLGLLTNDSRLYLQAVNLLQRAVEQDVRFREGWMSLANAYSQLYINTMDERIATLANDCYERLCQTQSRDPESWLGWAQLLGESGKLNRDPKKLKASIEKAARGTAIDSENPLLLCQWVESLSHLASLTNRLDLLIEAENKILRATDQFPDDPDLWHTYGICLIAFGQYYSDPDYYEQAIEKLQYGLSLDRTHAELWHALASAHSAIADLTDDLDMIERSTRFYDRAMDLKPACPALIFDAANAYLLSCDLHDTQEELDQSIILYESLLQNHKDSILNHPEWLFQYAAALEWLGDFTDDEGQFVRAMDLYLHVLLIDPETPRIHFRVAMCLVRLGESSIEGEYYTKAMNYFRMAARQDKEDDAIFLEWGLACIHLAHHTLHADEQHYADAEQKLIRAGQLGNLNAYYNLACLYSILGRYDEAMQLVRKAEKASALPPIEELLEDEWLDNLRQTKDFTEFLASIESSHGEK